ncbi:DNRLRE domain-containing protein [Nocardioides sp. HM23]|uniref:CBM96 family carbohydrate-binding protein n=1 Tax=Nocardioides bizhenqiangii TaxID=3095076 RepID=UPI002ACAB164|nr:DNRLRE domain-containing protein [Nocardioides sp. HM23]MDZ5623345.1 DNRLRE domain-containing protein [Nocardioides sp. HM23]
MRFRRAGLAAIGGGLLGLAAATTTTAPLTDASPPAAAVVTTTTSTAIADTYVAEFNKGANFGARDMLAVDASAVQRTFIKFTLSGITEPITSAKLRLHVNDISGAGSNSGGTWALMSDTTWTETAVTYNNQPAIDGATLGTVGPVARNSWVEIDVTAHIAGNGTYSIGGTSSSADGAEYDSRETGATAPQLVITTGTPPPADPVIVGAGDIATAGSGDTKTAALINALPDAAVYTTGDNSQGNGTAEEFAAHYEPSWGVFKARTRPVPGNHDYKTPGATGYYDYFGPLAGPSGLGYYSYDIGEWHLVALNSEITMAKGSAQEVWLRNDLALSTKPCTLAYWHRPLYTSGATHKPAIATRPLFRALYDNNAEVVLNGHNHQYERFAPMDPFGVPDATRGIRQFVVGTGGASHYAFGTVQPNSEVRDNVAYGVLKLTLRAASYDWEFIPIAGQTFTDSGSGACH